MLEICVDTLESARNAINGGAKRLELCSALSEGGLTPTPGLVKLVKQISNNVPIYAMLRVRQGNFVYSPEEVQVMLEDLQHLKKTEIDGFVFGALTEKGTIDEEVCRKIVDSAKPLPVTFHRAFDDTRCDALEALGILIDLGFERVLTSGREDNVEKGMKMICKLVKMSGKKIIVMPGSGITVENLAEVRKCTKAEEFHASARKKKENEGGSIFQGGFVADEKIVAEMAMILRNAEF